MKILSIIASPRKNGKTFRLVRQVEDKLKTLGEFECEHLFLADADLKMCQGCAACLSAGEDYCPVQDDRKAIEEQILNCNGVILASPVYAMNMTALMKKFMDRFAFTMHRPRFFHQPALIVCTTGIVGLKETIKSIAAIRFCGFPIIDSVGAVIPDDDLVTEKDKADLAKNVERAARKFSDSVNNKKQPSPTFEGLVQFRVQQAIFSLLQDRNPADYAYFQDKGWFDSEAQYFVEANVNPIKEFFARRIASKARRNFQKQL